jgi:pre-rRNA-processing protein TSR3
LLVGKLFGFQLRVQQFPVDGQLEAAPAGGDQLQVLNLLLERRQQFARQTDGLRFVTSHRAVSQFQMHDDLLSSFLRRLNERRSCYSRWRRRPCRVRREVEARMESLYPPTIIVRHPHENPRKCSVLPLRGRADVLFLSYPVTERPALDGYLRLAAEGPPLSASDAGKGILLLDGSWRWAAAMTRDFVEVPPRSLHGWHTAYPRVSKLGTDPDNGLASIEALFAAYRLLGRPTTGLLDHYYWAEEFLRANGLQVGGE